MLYSAKRQKCIFTIINIIVIVTFLWSNLVWAGGLYSARSPVSSNKDTLSPSSGLPALLTDATVDAIALETIKTLGSGNLSDIKVFYQQNLEEELRQKCGDVRCFGIQDVKREKGKWAFYVADLNKNELIRFTTTRDISDLFFNELKDITVRAGEEFKADSSYTFNLNGKDYIREVYSITNKNSPFIQMCLDRIHTYPIVKKQIKMGGFTKGLIKEYLSDKNGIDIKGIDLSQTGERTLENLLEIVLREYNIIKPGEQFLGYTETLDWERGGGETYIAKGVVSIKTNSGEIVDREFIAKAIVKMFPEEYAKEWLKRMDALNKMGIKVPEVYCYRKGVIYEEFIASSPIGIEQSELLDKLAYIACVLDTLGFYPIEILSAIINNGKDLYYIDVGEDLGGYKGEPYLNCKSLTVLEKGLMFITSSELKALRAAYYRNCAQVYDNAVRLGLISGNIEEARFTGTEYSEIIRLRGLLKGKTVLFMGPSNSGKGFYGKRIARLLGLKHVSYGDMVREVGNTTRDGDLRRVIEEASQKGGLLPDNIAESILKEGLKDIPEGIILDGFPRTVEQAMMLDTIRPVDVVILLETPEEALYDFIESRVVCKKCGEVYSKRFTRPKDPSFRCDHCGGELVRRVTPDGRLIDTRETLERKLLTYNKETVSVINYYSGRGIVNRFCTKAGSDVPEHLLETEYDEQTGSRNIYITPKGERILNFTGAIKNSLVLFKTPFLNGLREIEDFISANPTAGLKEIEDKVDEIYNRLAASVRVPPHILARWKIELYMSAFGEIDPSYTKSLFQIYNKLIQPESDFILFVTSLSQETSIPLKRFYRAIFPNYNEEINTVSIFEFNFSPDDYFRIMKLGIHLQSKKIIIQGPPGSGKGFWGERLAGILGMQHISFGDYVREIGSTTSDAELRQAIQEAADKGGVIADEYAFRIMEGIMNQCNGDVILEGFPRTVRQAEWLVDKTGIDAVIEIDVPKSLLFDRVQGRVVCSECGLVYNLLFDDLNYNETREPICKRDGKVLTRRMTPDGTAKDADRGVLERRLKFYFEETAPVHGVFSKRGKSFRVSNRVSPGETVPESNLQTVNVDGAKRIYSMTEDGSVVTVLNENSFVSRWFDVLERMVSNKDEEGKSFRGDNIYYGLLKLFGREGMVEERIKALASAKIEGKGIGEYFSDILGTRGYKVKAVAVIGSYLKYLRNGDVDINVIVEGDLKSQPLGDVIEIIFPDGSRRKCEAYLVGESTIQKDELLYARFFYRKAVVIHGGDIFIGIKSPSAEAQREAIESTYRDADKVTGEKRTHRLIAANLMEYALTGKTECFEEAKRLWVLLDTEEAIPKPIGPQGGLRRYEDIAKGFVPEYELEYKIDAQGFILKSGPKSENTGRLAEFLGKAFGMLAESIKKSTIMGDLWRDIIANSNNQIPIVIKVSHTLQENSARYYNKVTGKVEIILNQQFVEELLASIVDSQWSAVLTYLLLERLFHEFGHDNRRGTSDEEREEEKRQILRDVALYLLLGGEQKSSIKEYFNKRKPRFRSGYYFRNIISRVAEGYEVKDISCIVRGKISKIKMKIINEYLEGVFLSEDSAAQVVEDESRDSYYAREGLTFEEYVSFSLYESTLGYFSSGKVRFGWGGEKSHFATYPELLAEHKGRPFFGGMTAEQIFNMWKGMIEGGSIRKGEDFTIMEFGGGNGKYAYEILSYIRKKSTEDPEWRDFYNALKYKLVDIARDTEERLMPRFEEFGDKFSVEAGDARTLHDPKRSNIPDNSINGVILSFELIDNIPPHRVKVYPDGKIEVAVAMPKANRDKLAEFLGQLGCSDRLDEFKQINDDLIRDLEVTALDSHFYLGRRGLWLLEGLVRDYLAKNSKRKEEIDRMYQELISFEEKYIPSKYSQDVEQFYKENKNIIDSFASSLEGPRVVYIPVSGNNFIKGASRVLNKGYVVTMDYGGLFAHQYEYGFNEPFRTFPQSLGKEVNGDFYKVFLRGDLTYDVPFDFLVESGKRSDLSLEVFGKLGLLGCNTSYEDWLGHDRLHEVLSERFKEIGFPEDQLDRVICDLVLRNYKDYYRSMIYDPRNMQLLVQKKAGTESSWRIKHPIVDAKPAADFSGLYEERRKAIACVRETEAKVRENTDESRKYALEDELGYAKEYLQNARKELHEAEYLRYIRENIGNVPDGMVKTFPQQFDAEGEKVETIPADRLDTIEIDSNISKGVVLHVAMGQPLHIKVKLSGVISDIRDLRVMVRTNACSFDSTGNYIDSEISESFDPNVFTTMSRRDMELINVGRDLWEVDIPCDYCGNFYLTVYVVDPATNQRKWLGGDAYVSVFPSWVKGASIAVTSLRHMREKEPENMDRLGTFTDLEWDIRQKAEQGFNALLLLPITDTSEDSPYGQISPYALNPEHIDWEKVTSGVRVPPKDIEEAKRILQQLESEKEFQEWRAGQAQSGFFEDLKEYARLRAVKRMTQATHLELYAQILTLKRLIDNGTAQLKEEESGIINSLIGYIELAIEKGVSFWDIEFTDNDFRIIDKIIDTYWNEDNQKQYGFFMSYYMPIINKLRLDMINRCEKGILFLGHVEFVLYEQFIAQKQLKEALRIAQSLNVHLLFDQPFFPSTEGAISVFHPERVEWMGPEGDRIKYAGCYGDSPDTYNEQHWVSLARWNYGAGSETVYKARLDAIAKPINYWVGFGFAGFRWDALHFGNYDLWQTLRNNYLQGKSVFPLGEQIGCLSSVERQLMNLGYILYKATQFQSYCPSALEDAFVESNWITWFVTADTHDSPRLYTLFKPYFQAGLGQNPDPILVNRAMLLEFAFASSVFCMMSGSEYGNTERINVPGVGTDWRGVSPHAVSASKGDLRGFVKKLNELRQTHPAMKAQGNLIKIDNSLGKGFQDEGGVSSLARLHENGSLVLVNNLSGFQQEVKVYIPFSLLHINPYKPFKIRNVLEEEGIKDIPPENYTLGNEYISFRLEPGQSVIWELLPNDTIFLEEWESKLEGETGLMRLLTALTPIQKRRLVYGSKNDAFVVTRYNKPIYSSPCSGLVGLQSIFNNVHDLWALNHHVEKGDFCNFLIQSVLIGDEFIELKKWFYNLMLVKDTPDRKREALQRAINSIMDILTPGMVKPVQMTYVLQAHQPPDDERKYKSWYRLHTLRSYYPTIASLYSKDMKGVRIGYSFSTTLLELIMGFNRSTEELFRIAEGYKDLGDLRLRIAQYLEAVERDTTTRIDKGFELLLKPCSEWTNEDRLYVVNSCWEVHPQYIAKIPGFVALRKRLGLEDPKVSYTKFIDQNQQVALANEDAKALLLAFTACYIAPQLRGKDVGLAGKDLDGKFTSDTVDFSKVYTVDFNFAEAAKDDVFCLSFALDQAKVMRMLPKTISLVSINNELKKAIETNTDLQSAIEEGNPEPYGGLKKSEFGHMELMACPGHIILPLFIDQRDALGKDGRPEGIYAYPFKAPRDAMYAIQYMKELFMSVMGVDIISVWPAECATSPDSLRMLRKEGILIAPVSQYAFERTKMLEEGKLIKDLQGYYFNCGDINGDGKDEFILVQPKNFGVTIDFKIGPYSRNRDGNGPSDEQSVEIAAGEIRQKYTVVNGDTLHTLGYPIDSENAASNFSDWVGFWNNLWKTVRDKYSEVQLSSPMENLLNVKRFSAESNKDMVLPVIGDSGVGSWNDSLRTWAGKNEEQHRIWRLIDLTRNALVEAGVPYPAAPILEADTSEKKAWKALFGAETSCFPWHFDPDMRGNPGAYGDIFVRLLGEAIEHAWRAGYNVVPPFATKINGKKVYYIPRIAHYNHDYILNSEIMPEAVLARLVEFPVMRVGAHKIKHEFIEKGILRTKMAGCWETFEIFFDDFLPKDIDSDFRKGLKAQSETEGIVYTVHAPAFKDGGGYFKLDNDDDYKHFEDTVKFASDIGAEVVTIHFANTKESYVSAVKRLAEYARGLGVKIAIENTRSDSGAYCKPKDLNKLFRLLDGLDNVGICFDVGHANLTGMTPIEYMKRLHKKIKILNAHFHDNNGTNPDHLQIGQAFGRTDGIDFKAVLLELVKIGYEGSIIIEHGWDTLPFERRYIEEILDSVMMNARRPVGDVEREVAEKGLSPNQKLLEIFKMIDDTFEWAEREILPQDERLNKYYKGLSDRKPAVIARIVGNLTSHSSRFYGSFAQRRSAIFSLQYFENLLSFYKADKRSVNDARMFLFQILFSELGHTNKDYAPHEQGEKITDETKLIERDLQLLSLYKKVWSIESSTLAMMVFEWDNKYGLGDYHNLLLSLYFIRDDIERSKAISLYATSGEDDIRKLLNAAREEISYMLDWQRHIGAAVSPFRKMLKGIEEKRTADIKREPGHLVEELEKIRGLLDLVKNELINAKVPICKSTILEPKDDIERVWKAYFQAETDCYPLQFVSGPAEQFVLYMDTFVKHLGEAVEYAWHAGYNVIPHFATKIKGNKVYYIPKIICNSKDYMLDLTNMPFAVREKLINLPLVLPGTRSERGKLIEESLSRAVGDDFRSFEIYFEGFLPNDIKPDFRQFLKTQAETQGLTFIVHATWQYDPVKDPKIFTDIVEFARDIGSGVVTIHLTEPGKEYADAIRSLAILAKSFGIRIAIENTRLDSGRWCMPDDLNNTLGYLEDLDNVGICLDVGHANLTGISPVEYLNLLDKRFKIFNVHFHDNNGEKDQHNTLSQAVGTKGGIDFKAVLAELVHRGYDDSIIIEHGRETLAVERKFIEDVVSGLSGQDEGDTPSGRGVETFAPTEGEDDIKERFLKEVEIFDMQPEPMQKVVTYIDESANPYITVKVQLGSLKPEDVNVEIHYGSQIAGADWGEIRDALMTSYKVIDSEKGTYLYRGKMPLFGLDLGAYRFTTKVSLKAYKDTQQKKEFIKWHNQPKNDGILVVTEYSELEKKILSLYPEAIDWVRDHAERVARLSQIIAREIFDTNRDVPRFSKELIRLAALAHDLGKGCSQEMIDLINSTSGFDPRVKRHIIEGVSAFRNAGIYIPIIEEVILNHHYYDIDGRCYGPRFIEDNDAKFIAEIIFVADQIEASQATGRGYKLGEIADIDKLCREMDEHKKAGRISDRVCNAVTTLLSERRRDFMDVIYEARKDIKWSAFVGLEADEKEQHPLEKKGPEEEEHLFTVTFDEYGKNVKTAEKKRTEKSSLYKEKYIIDALGVLVEKYEGPGILSGIKEIEVVNRTGPAENRVDSKARIDIDKFRDPDLVIKALEDEAIRKILALIMPDKPDLIEIFIANRSCKDGSVPEVRDVERSFTNILKLLNDLFWAGHGRQVRKNDLDALTIKELLKKGSRIRDELEREYITTDNDDYAGFLEWVFENSGDNIDLGALREKRRANRGKDTQGCLAARLGLSDDGVDLEKRGYRKLDVNGALDVLNSLGLDLSSYMDVSVDGGRRVERISCDEVWVGIQQGAVEVWVDEAGNRKMVKVKDIAIYNDKGIPSWGELIKEAVKGSLIEDAIKKMCGYSGRDGHLVDITGAERLIVVGDLHGNYRNLMAILSQGDIWDSLIEGKAHLVILGDAIHPGSGVLESPDSQEDSFKTLLLLMKLITKFPKNVHYIFGDHEFVHLDKGARAVKESDSGKDVCQNIIFEDFLVSNYSAEFLRKIKGFFGNLPYVQRINKSTVLTHAGATEKAGNIEQIKELDMNDPEQVSLIADIIFRSGEGRDIAEDVINSFLSLTGCDLIITGHTVPNFINAEKYGFKVIKEGAIGEAYGKQIIIDSQSDSPGYMDMDLTRSDLKKGLGYLVDKEGRPALKTLGEDVLEEAVDEIYTILTKNWGIDIARNAVWEVVVGAKGEAGAPKIERLIELVKETSQLELMDLFKLAREISKPIGLISDRANNGGKLIANILEGILIKMEESRIKIAQGNNMREMFFNTIRELLVSYGATKAEVTGILNFIKEGLFLLEFEPLLNIVKVANGYFDYLKFVCELCGVDEEALRGIFSDSYSGYQEEQIFEKLGKRKEDINPKDLEKELRRKGLWENYKRIEKIKEMIRDNFRDAEVVQNLDSPLSKAVRRLRLYKHIVDNKISGEVDINSGIAEDLVGLAEAVDFRRVSVDTPQGLNKYLSLTSVAQEWGSYLVGKLDIDENKRQIVSIPEELFVGQKGGEYSLGLVAVLKQVHGLTVEIRTKDADKLNRIVDILKQSHPEIPGLEDRIKIVDEFNNAGDVEERQNTVYVLGEGQENIGRDLEGKIKENTVKAFSAPGMALYGVVLYGALMASVEEMFGTDYKYTDEGIKVIQKLGYFVKDEELIEDIIINNRAFVIIKTEKLLEQYVLEMATIGISA